MTAIELTRRGERKKVWIQLEDRTGLEVEIDCKTYEVASDQRAVQAVKKDGILKKTTKGS